MISSQIIACPFSSHSSSIPSMMILSKPSIRVSRLRPSHKLIWQPSYTSFNHQRHNSTTSPQLSTPETIFSGIQPTGIPHLGNYLGALNQWVHLQNTSPPGTKLLFSVVDLHAITVPQSPELLRRWKSEALATLLAIGLDPERCVLFFQSAVSERGKRRRIWYMEEVRLM